MNIIFLALAFFLIGVAIYYLDLIILRLSSKWFPRKVYEDKSKGILVVRRLFRRRLLVASLIVAAEILFSIRYGKADLQWDIVYGLIEGVTLMLGFYGAAWFLRIAPRRLNQALDYAERVESGKADVGEDLRNTVRRVNITATIGTDSPRENKADARTDSSSEKSENSIEEKKRISSKDLDDSIDEFRKK